MPLSQVLSRRPSLRREERTVSRLSNRKLRVVQSYIKRCQSSAHGLDLYRMLPCQSIGERAISITTI